MEQNKQIYLIHGYTASPTANWFPWLKRKVNHDLHQKITLLTMPNPDNPIPAKWDEYCDREITATDDITIIGHSLGCIQTLRFIEQHALKNVHLILVSGFDESLATLPELDTFTNTLPNYNNILQKVADAVVISALDDDIVPFYYTETLARHLKCKFILMPTGKHFISRDNITELPVVFEELAKI